MIVAVVSGKGGTGKTILAASLARAWARRGEVLLADCDVEGPNAHNFLPEFPWANEIPVAVPVPAIDPGACDGCGACADACYFHALAVIGGKTLLFETMCHGCGTCIVACPLEAISERMRPVGIIRQGAADGLQFVQGILEVGEPRAVPVIDAVLARTTAVSSGVDVILDGPPGASCSVAEVVRAADACLMVTEATPFGLHDLARAHELILTRRKPAAVILNRSRGHGDDEMVKAWCLERNIPLLQSIPDRREIAEGYARGLGLLDTWKGGSERLLALRAPLRRLASDGEGRIAV